MRSSRLIDTDSGEVLYAVVQVPRKRYIGGFFMGMQDGFRHIAQLPLRGESRRVLEYLFGVLDFENYIRVTHTDIAEQLQMSRPNVGRAVAELLEARVLLPGPKVAGSASYRLDPMFGWKGRESSRRRALRVVKGR